MPFRNWFRFSHCHHLNQLATCHREFKIGNTSLRIPGSGVSQRIQDTLCPRIIPKAISCDTSSLSSGGADAWCNQGPDRVEQVEPVEKQFASTIFLVVKDNDSQWSTSKLSTDLWNRHLSRWKVFRS